MGMRQFALNADHHSFTQEYLRCTRAARTLRGGCTGNSRIISCDSHFQLCSFRSHECIHQFAPPRTRSGPISQIAPRGHAQHRQASSSWMVERGKNGVYAGVGKGHIRERE